MDLGRLQDDIFGFILAYLDSLDCVNLGRVGNHRLSGQIKRKVRKWKIKVFPFNHFPFSLFNTPDLESLDVSLARGNSVYPLNLSDRLLMPSVTQNALISLKLSFSRSFRVLEDSTLSHTIPNLQYLDLEDSYTELSLQHLENLPSKLKSLNLLNFSRQLTFSLSIDKLASLIPQYIEHIGISRLNLTAIGRNVDPTTLTWPENLKSISVHSALLPHFFSHCPSNLEELLIKEVSLGYDKEISVKTIPKSLKRFEITDMINPQPEWILDAALPSEMTILRVRISKIMHLSQLAMLPPSLKYIYRMEHLRTSFPNENFSTLLPNIEELNILAGSSIQLHWMPRELKSMFISSSISPFILSHLPSHLTLLNFFPSPGIQLEALPRTLTQLDLQIGHKTPTPSLDASQWRQLPPHLTSLQLDLFMLDSISDLAAIPSQHLKILKLRAMSLFDDSGPMTPQELDKRTRYEAILNDTTLASLLPSQLEHFYFEAQNLEFVWPQWIAQLAEHIPELRSLEVKVPYIIIKGRIPPAENFLSTLPPRLQELQIPLDHSHPLPTAFFSILPKSLSTFRLTIPKIHGNTEPSVYTEEHFAHLPSNLCTFEFQTHCSGVYVQASEPEVNLTPEIFSVLPPYLSTFPLRPALLGRYEWKDAWLEYLDSEKWLECPPRQG